MNEAVEGDASCGTDTSSAIDLLANRCGSGQNVHAAPFIHSRTICSSSEMNCQSCQINCHQVVLAYLDGSTDASQSLFSKFGPLIRGMIRKGLFVNPQQESKDCENELWAKVLEKQPEFWLKKNFLSWASRVNLPSVDGTPAKKAKGLCDFLRIVASRHIITWNRASRRRFVELPSGLEAAPIGDEQLNKERAVSDCVASFPDEYRELFRLWHTMDLPWDELMIACGYSHGTLANRLRELKAMLIQCLQQKGFGVLD